MRFRVRVFALCVGMAAILGASAVSISAQDPAKKDEPAKGARRVPPGFSKVGITQEQRDKIYAVQAKFSEKIVPLQKQLEALRAEELAACEAVLTDAQKKLLGEQRQENATKKRRGAEKKETTSKDAADKAAD
jgi:Spy/CpxP family protein refolding chaperone